jgi:hypothetical protein
MSVSGLCDICDRPDVDHGCDRCGRLVCDRHWDEHRGVCVECGADTGGGSPGEPAPEDLPDGVDAYEF